MVGLGFEARLLCLPTTILWFPEGDHTLGRERIHAGATRPAPSIPTPRALAWPNLEKPADEMGAFSLEPRAPSQ